MSGDGVGSGSFEAPMVKSKEGKRRRSNSPNLQRPREMMKWATLQSNAEAEKTSFAISTTVKQWVNREAEVESVLDRA
jgi:hypothetical protein